MTTQRSGSYARADLSPAAPGPGSSAPAPSPLSSYAGVPALERLEIELLLEAIWRHYGHDFRLYAFSSLRRRLKKRLEAEGLSTFSALQERILHDPEAMNRLLGDLSVNVTGMFRDPTFFLAIRQRVVPILRTYPFVRIWHAGCASGEEVYALAILLEEEGLYERARIYATDINADAIERAKRGIFPLARMREFTGNYIGAGGQGSFSEYYTARYDAALFHPRLRRNVLFAQHNLATDASFSEFNLILCRNVLIYFSRELKDRVLDVFQTSLAPFGILCVGRRESLRFTNAEGDFEELDPKERIYRRRR
jgi:chemotaxis protein methyltransferase CheR